MDATPLEKSPSDLFVTNLSLDLPKFSMKSKCILIAEAVNNCPGSNSLNWPQIHDIL